MLHAQSIDTGMKLASVVAQQPELDMKWVTSPPSVRLQALPTIAVSRRDESLESAAQYFTSFDPQLHRCGQVGFRHPTVPIQCQIAHWRKVEQIDVPIVCVGQVVLSSSQLLVLLLQLGPVNSKLMLQRLSG